jgi:hypothetical protein
MSNGVGNPSKTPLMNIQREIEAAASRAATAENLMQVVIVDGRDPKDDEALNSACSAVEAHMKEALRLIHLYRA